MLTKARSIYREFPTSFWTLIGATFIDRLGGALIFPFLSLYITQRFNVGMVEVGKLFAIFALSSVFGGVLGGALTDRFGRRGMIIFGLVVSALSSLSMGLVDELRLFYFLAVVVGLLSNAGGPAQQAMVADMLPEAKRTEGYGIHRVVANLAVTIGPAIGGLLASRSYLYLFIFDAVSSILTAAIVLAILPETRPRDSQSKPPKSLAQTMGGYLSVARDRLFIAFLVVTVLEVMVYMQMNSTLAVFLRDVHGVTPQGFGYILSLNAGMVVVFQFWITRRLSGLPPLLLLAAGTLLYALGFAMYGFVSIYPLFLLAMIVITIGEMIVTPVAQALVARLAPEAMRGRYMALYGLSWLLPTAVGPLAAGLIMDTIGPYWVWYSAGLVGLIAAACYLGLHTVAGMRLASRQMQNTTFST